MTLPTGVVMSPSEVIVDFGEVMEWRCDVPEWCHWGFRRCHCMKSSKWHLWVTSWRRWDFGDVIGWNRQVMSWHPWETSWHHLVTLWRRRLTSWCRLVTSLGFWRCHWVKPSTDIVTTVAQEGQNVIWKKKNTKWNVKSDFEFEFCCCQTVNSCKPTCDRYV